MKMSRYWTIVTLGAVVGGILLLIVKAFGFSWDAALFAGFLGMAVSRTIYVITHPEL